ncbi:MAG: L-threonylcarbamoyladenylate synthase [Cyanobacteria bacterium P01_F01_bin.42]
MPQQSIASLVAHARSGALVSFPTDTVPALASLPESAEKIFRVKERSQHKSLILMGAGAADLWPYIQNQNPNFEAWQAIAAEHWPGALTLVLPSSELVPTVMHPHTPDTIGIRVPDCAIARLILEQTGPLATTSINRSGQDALRKLEQIEAEFPQVFVPLTKFWAQPSDAIASTVIEWQGQDWQLHRQGNVNLLD